MPHINTIGASMYSDLAVAQPATAPNFNTLTSAANWSALFATEIANVGGTKAAGTFVRFSHVREFPPMGVPPNVVNVPTYGQATSKQVQGQADPSSLELTLNYIPSDWAKESGILLGNLVGDGNNYAFRFTLLNSKPTATGATAYSSTAGGLGTVQNTQLFWFGKIDALMVNPSLTDATTATLTLTMQSSLFGPFTV